MYKEGQDKQQQSSVLSVRIKDNDSRRFGSTTLLTPKKPSMMNSSSKSSSQSEYKQINLNKKDLFRNKTLNNISSTPGHKNKNFQSPFGGNGKNSNSYSNCNSGNKHSGSTTTTNGNSKSIVGVSAKAFCSSAKNTTAKQITFTTTNTNGVGTGKKQRPPLFVIQEKKGIDSYLNVNSGGIGITGNEGSNAGKEDIGSSSNNGRNMRTNGSNVSSSSKAIQMNKISLKEERQVNNPSNSHSHNKTKTNIHHRHQQNYLTVRTTTLPSNFKSQKESSHSQTKNNSRLLKNKPPGTNAKQSKTHQHNHPQQLQYRNKKLENPLDKSIKKATTTTHISNSLLPKEHSNSHSKTKNNTNNTKSQHKTTYITSNSINSNSSKKKYNLSLNGSSDNFSFANPSKSKLKSASINLLRQNIPIIHFYTAEYVLSSYAKVLTQREVDELRTFDDSIYFIGKLPYRKAGKLYEKNDLLKSFNESINNNTNDNFDMKSFIAYQPCKSMHHLYPTNDDIYLYEPYDDEESDYNLIIGDHIYYRYEVIKLLGKGSFGEAIKCFDHKTNESVCIKLIKSNQRFQSQALTEINLLEHIKSNDKDNESNIVKYYSNFLFRNHKCIVFELLNMNLYEYIKSRHYNGIELRKIKSYTTELLFTLLYLKRNNIIHCDLKPENILLCRNSKVNVKTIDFGSSCFDNEKMYCYIQSRFYRAPEIILDQGYGIEIDMWSLGCIIAELYTGIPIFPGEEERDQLNYMMEYLDVPPNDYINMSRKRDMFFDEHNHPLRIPNSKGKIRLPKTKAIASFLQGSDDYFQNFVRRCLRWFPEDRMTPEEGLMHQWIVQDMTSEALYLHKQKIKRIRCGISKAEQKGMIDNGIASAGRVTMKQKSVNVCGKGMNKRDGSKKRKSCLNGRDANAHLGSGINSSKRNKEKGHWNINMSNISSVNSSNSIVTKALSTKHSTINGKIHVSLSLEDNNNTTTTAGNINTHYNHNHTIDLNQTNTTHSNLKINTTKDKITEYKDKDKDKEKQSTPMSIKQRYSFIDLAEDINS